MPNKKCMIFGYDYKNNLKEMQGILDTTKKKLEKLGYEIQKTHHQKDHHEFFAQFNKLLETEADDMLMFVISHGSKNHFTVKMDGGSQGSTTNVNAQEFVDQILCRTKDKKFSNKTLRVAMISCYFTADLAKKISEQQQKERQFDGLNVIVSYCDREMYANETCVEEVLKKVGIQKNISERTNSVAKIRPALQ